MVSIFLVIVSDFNSRPCERGFGIGGKYHDGIKNFNSRPCERGFESQDILRYVCRNFNSRPCERGFNDDVIDRIQYYISIHAPARGASSFAILSTARENFNSRPCERGFIRTCYPQGWICYNFNSRPCERGFSLTPLLCIPESYFNSRPCERGFIPLLIVSYSNLISIHAPARGASTRKGYADLRFTYFNSRPCERGFNLLRIKKKGLSNFNSRPCERGFNSAGKFVGTLSISIHAPARGASVMKSTRLSMMQFQFTPLREGLLFGGVKYGCS